MDKINIQLNIMVALNLCVNAYDYVQWNWTNNWKHLLEVELAPSQYVSTLTYT